MDLKAFTCTASEIGDVLDLTDRRVRQLAEEGVFPRASRGQYPLRECVLAYVAAQATTGDVELRSEKIALLKAQRRRIELDNSNREGTTAGFDYQDALVEVFALHWHLQARNVANWLHSELSLKPETSGRAREIAGKVANWLIALRSDLETQIKAAAAEARRRGVLIASYDDFKRLVGQTAGDLPAGDMPAPIDTSWPVA